ncbi:MAG: hypothetical protein WBB25_13865, partial [Sulfitobacter sp.]
VPERALDERRQMLAARVSLAMDKPFKAMADLINLKSPEASLLREGARRMTGEHDEAHQLYASGDQQTAVAEAARLSEGRPALTSVDTAISGEFAEIGAGSTDKDEPEKGMLARAASLLEESVRARETLQSLLQAQDLQPTIRSQ